MAESENVYVKIGERGRYLEREATTPRDHVNLRGTGWLPKGHPDAPTEKDADVKRAPKTRGLTNTVPTSQRAYAEKAEKAEKADAGTARRTTNSTAPDSVGARADAESRANNNA